MSFTVLRASSQIGYPIAITDGGIRSKECVNNMYKSFCQNETQNEAASQNSPLFLSVGPLQCQILRLSKS